MDFLHREIAGGVTVLQAASIAIGLVVVVTLFRLLQRVFSSASPGEYQSRMKCIECGWVGNVSRHIPTCAKCRSRSMRPA